MTDVPKPKLVPIPSLRNKQNALTKDVVIPALTEKPSLQEIKDEDVSVKVGAPQKEHSSDEGVLIYCSRCKEKTGTSDLKMEKNKSEQPILRGVCVECGAKKTKRMKKSEVPEEAYELDSDSLAEKYR